MHTIPDNATRIKRFRELKATLRTRRDRLLVGIDIAKAQHVAQVRLAHTRVLDPQVTVPNTQAGFEGFWARLAAHRRDARVVEVVCAVEPTGTYHQALATFLEARGATVVLVNNHVAQLNRRTLDGTWDKSDPKDAHNLGDLLEQGKVLFYSLPGEPLADLRRLVRLLRRARAEASACKVRFTTTLLPQFGPVGDGLPPAAAARLPAPLQAWLPPPARPRRAPAAAAAPVPAGLAFELTDLAARLAAGQARSAAIGAELVRRAERVPAYGLLRTIPGIGPTVAAILVAEIGDIAWDHEVQPAPQARGAGHRPAAVRAVGGDRADLQGRVGPPAVGVVPSRHRGDPEPGLAGAARGAHREAPGRSPRLRQGQRRAGGQAPPARVGGLAERAAV
jgi:transposase